MPKRSISLKRRNTLRRSPYMRQRSPYRMNMSTTTDDELKTIVEKLRNDSEFENCVKKCVTVKPGVGFVLDEFKEAQEYKDEPAREYKALVNACDEHGNLLELIHQFLLPIEKTTILYNKILKTIDCICEKYKKDNCLNDAKQAFNNLEPSINTLETFRKNLQNFTKSNYGMF